MGRVGDEFGVRDGKEMERRWKGDGKEEEGKSEDAVCKLYRSSVEHNVSLPGRLRSRWRHFMAFIMAMRILRQYRKDSP